MPMKTADLHDDPLLAGIPEVDGFKVLEPCVLYSKLGEGGMGAVYHGRHLNLDIDVAVKCLRRSLSDHDDTFVRRFQREARIAAGIHHQNLVQVYNVSQRGGVHYLVMEYVSGETARDRVRRKGRLAVDEALRIAFGAATGLSVAHARRIVHRDVKPDNVLIARDGSVKVSDLGLAKAMETDMESSLTQGVMGTPQYMAPEQWDDASKVTPAADVWAFGATLWFLLGGADPIQATSMQQALKQICFQPFPDIRAVRDDVPADVVRLIERCVARDRAERFADCGEVLAELRRFVGRDQGELVSRPGELLRIGATLVSPPPAETIAKIRLQMESKGGGKPPAPAQTVVRATPAAGKAETLRIEAPRSRRKLWIGGGALAGAGLIVLVYAAFLRPKAANEPHVAPASTETARASNAAAPLTKREVEQQESARPERAKQEVSKSESAKAGASTPTGAKPESAQPEGAQPASVKPSGAKEEAAKPQASPSESSNVESSKSESAKAESTKPESAKPESSKGESAKPDSSKTDTSKPPSSKPEAAPKSAAPAPAPAVARTLVPKDCAAIGDETVDIGGARWAKRIQHRRSKIFLVLIPPGSFTMGSTVATDAAPPPRTISITHGFYMSEDEVSEAEYAAVIGSSAASATRTPHAGASWEEADKFCRKAGFELPREAEWEYACRAGSTKAYAFGAELGKREGATARQGALQPCGFSVRNAFGLADMHGNLREFCVDAWLSPEEYARLPDRDPVGKKGTERVLRGGSYASQPEYCTSAARKGVEQDKPQRDAGLRVILRID